MFRKKGLSKSAKRRRLLDANNFIEYLSDDIHLDISPNNNIDNIISSLVSSELNNHKHEVNTVSFETSTSSSAAYSFDQGFNNDVSVGLGLDYEIMSHSEVESPEESDDNSIHEMNDQRIPERITNDLIEWATNHNIPNNAFDNLLKVLKSHKCFEDFPSTSRTFYKIHSGVSYDKPVQVKPIAPGIYYHFGVASSIKKYIDKHFSDETIKLVIGVDGLPLTKSSGSCFWPILSYIRQNIETVFLIGIYWGYNKPVDGNLFIKDFVDEISSLIINGIYVDIIIDNTLKTVHKKVAIDSFCCDAPAKAFLLKTKSHTGFFSCTRCTVQGKYVLRRVCFPELKCSKRTHVDFVNKVQRQYHSTDGNITEILNIPGIDVVQQFSLDYMHAVCLGTMKKMLMLWKGDNIGRGDANKQKLSPGLIKKMSERLLSLKNDIPLDFVRKPRSLDELPRWKATEFRLFLLYVGPVIIHSIVSKQIFQNFLCLNVAMTIFLSPNYNHLATYAKSLMFDFVKNFGLLYGDHFISDNIHGLINLYDDYQNYGMLDNISCFKFENYMSHLKKMVRKSDKPLQQVVRRYEERSKYILPTDSSTHLKETVQFKQLHNKGPLITHTSSPQYKIVVLDKIKINVDSNADSFVGVKLNGIINIVRVVNVCYSQELKKNVLLGKKIERMDNFFTKPIKSEKLGIFKVNHFSKQLSVWNIDDVITKYMILKAHDLNCMIAYPIIHFNN